MNSTPTTEINPLPSNWRAGFQKGRYRIACDGLEIPVYHPTHGWMVLVWDQQDRKHLYYFYKSDTFSD